MAAFAWAGLVALIAVANAFPYSGDPMENPDLFQGDIIGEDEDRNAVPTKNRRWPFGKIPYIIDNSLRIYAPRIRAAMDHIERNTCIKFVPRGNERDYIKLFAGQGCYSYWGYVARGEQPLSLGRGCEWTGTMMHELLHAVGFAHEQNRSDRDEFLTINWDNIKPDFKSQFAKLNTWENRLITPFDYSSIMIYGELSFSKDRSRNLRTMVPKQAGVRLVPPDQKTTISSDDVKRINVLYDCPKQ